MNQRISLISGSNGVAKTKKPTPKSGETKVSPAELDPTDGYTSGITEAPSKEVVENGESAPKVASEAAKTPVQSTSSEPLTVISQVEAEAAPVERGTTFGDFAKSATAAVGNTFRKYILGDPLVDFKKDLGEINDLEAAVKRELKTPEQFAKRTEDLQNKLKAGASLDDIRDEAYAVAREAARQTTGMRAYDCQILGGLAMNHGQIAEMRTGEGKTLTAVMPLYLNALAGKGAHLITVNETLAKRDSEWMGPIFEKLGMSVGCVLEDQTAEQKRDGYNCDVTYLTDRTLGFDFLRDRTAKSPDARVQRGLFFGLVDEVDEVMIDEARTPMILSVKGEKASADYGLFASITKDLKPGQDFEVNEQQTAVWLTEGGLRYVENEVVIQTAEAELKEAPPGSQRETELRKAVNQGRMLRGVIRSENEAKKKFDDEDDKKPNILARAVGLNGEYDSELAGGLESTWQAAKKLREQLSKDAPKVDLYGMDSFERVHYLDACLNATVLQVKGKHYSVEGGEVKIIDQNKGRTSKGKRFSNGLHQGLEAKEGVAVREESRTAASITLPELFNTYERKSGMTGTGKSSEAEFHHFYGLPVVEIPTNKPVIREDHKDVVFATMDEKFNAVVEEAVKSAKEGRPVLVGTLSVNANKAVAARLVAAGWPEDRLQVLNAETVRSSEDVHEVNAGRSGTITLATGDRADQVMPDPVNYKKMAMVAEDAIAKGGGVVIDADTPEDAAELQSWIGARASVQLSDKAQAEATAGQVVIRVGARGETAPGTTHLDAKDYAVEKPLVLDVDPSNMEETIETALSAYFEGEPVVLRSKAAHGLSASAERLLDAGLGLESLPMVCEGKEKENVLIEMAGRAGFITVATNMAGRGANVKPDLVDIDEITEKAYGALSEDKGVVVDLNKDSEAVKIFRRLKAHCPVAVAETPEQKALPGQILLRSREDLPEGTKLPPVEGVTQFDGQDYKTNGLYVIGTERSNSRRIDDQLIGRAGRQGAPGDSRFFLSKQDDLLRLSQPHRLEEVEEAMGEVKTGVSSDAMTEAVNDIQEQMELQRIDARQNSDKFDETIKLQRKTFFKFREQFVSGGDEENAATVKEYMADFAAMGIADALQELLGDKRKYTAEEVKTAAAMLGRRTGMPLNIEPSGKKIKARDLANELYPAVSKLVEDSPLPQKEWQIAFVHTADQAWQDQLEAMAGLRDGVQLEAIAGKKPEEVYVHRGFEAFESMVGGLRRRLGTHVLPIMFRRGQEQHQQQAG